MLHHYYYVNGERVSFEQYVRASQNQAYEKDALKEALKYYEAHPWSWQGLCNTVKTNTPHPKVIISAFEWTPEGESFKKKWEEEAEKKGRRYMLVVFLLILGFILFMVIRTSL